MTEETGIIDRLSEYSMTVDQEQMLSLMRFAPWATDKKYPMTAEEFGLAIRRAVAMAVDPFNPHEVQIWKDNHGVHFQLAYTLLVEWVHKFYGGHTKPEFRELADEEKLERGLTPAHRAIECSFIMYSDLPRARDAAEVFGKEEARKMFVVRGVGVASAAEWNSQYFAPNGRDKAWKVEKRALVDAYRRKFGEPGPIELHSLRRERGQDQIRPEDWGKALQVEQGPQAAQLAAAESRVRAHLEYVEALPVEEQTARVADNSRVLFGGHDEEDPYGFDEPRVQVAELPEEPEPEPEPKPEPKPEPRPKPQKAARAPKLATIRASNWTTEAAAVADDCPLYKKGGQIDFFHMAGAAAKLGFDEVTNQNLAEVCQKLRDHARHKAEQQPALIPG